MSFIASVSAVVAASAPSPRVPRSVSNCPNIPPSLKPIRGSISPRIADMIFFSNEQASPPIRVSTSSNINAPSSQPPRSVSVAAALISASSIHTGSTKIQPTSTSRSSSSTPSTRQSASIPASTGSLTPYTSTESPAVSLPQASALAVSTRDIVTTRRRLAAERPGSDTTPCLCGDIDRQFELSCGIFKAVGWAWWRCFGSVLWLSIT